MSRGWKIWKTNQQPRPKRLYLIGQPLVGIEHSLDCAIEVAVVVLADRVEHVAASDSAGRQC